MSAVYVEMAAIFLLILLNGFFAMSEMAVVASRRIRLQTRADAGDGKARAVLKLLEVPNKFFSTVQIGITLVGIFTGAFGGITIAEKLREHFSAIPATAPYSGALSLGLVVIPLTYFTLILGELVPKRLAYSKPELLAGISAPIMRVLMTISLPAVKLLSASSELIVRALRVKPSDEPSVTEEEIRGMIGEGARVGVLEHVERDMLDRIIRLGDRQVLAMMTHRSKVIWLDTTAPTKETMRIIREHPYSRFPVAAGDLSNLIGILKAKDFLAAADGAESPALEDHIRAPLYVPETMRAFRLLELFKRRPGMHFAVIVDEYGDIQGIITLNDILEAIVGDIPAEEEQGDKQIVTRADGSWLMDALLPMDEVLSVLDVRQEEAGTYQTLAGFLLTHMGEIPAPGSYIDKYGYRFEVVDMDDKRIDAVHVSEQPE